MSSQVRAGFEAISRLRLWSKLRNSDELDMADFPEIISLRWQFFRSDWEFVKDSLKENLDSATFPEQLRDQIERLSRLIEIQRNSVNQNINPFLSSDIFNRYYVVWDNISLNIINLTKQETAIANNKIAEINRYTRTNFLEIRRLLREARDSIADTIGLSDADYDSSFDRRAGSGLKSPKVSDINNMQLFQAAIFECDNILANIFSLETATIDPFALARANANNPEITINDNNSGTFVAMEAGESLQSLSAKYLGDPDRWNEIAIANGLKAPFVDEIGEFVPLLSNASLSLINIAQSDASGNSNIKKFFIGQPVFISSDTFRFGEQREIINITTVPISNEIVIELSGENDLNRFKTSENAGIRVYRPNTINSNFLILIPNQQNTDNLPESQLPFFLQSKKEDERKAGVDLFLNDDFDLNLTSSSDLQLSFGINNASQAVKLKVASEQGQNFRHPAFGIRTQIGSKADNVELTQQQLVSSITSAVEVDDRFQRVESLVVALDDRDETKAFRVQLVVRMAGVDSLVPISFSVRAG
jgi:hypothetical protein